MVTHRERHSPQWETAEIIRVAVGHFVPALPGTFSAPNQPSCSPRGRFDHGTRVEILTAVQQASSDAQHILPVEFAVTRSACTESELVRPGLTGQPLHICCAGGVLGRQEKHTYLLSLLSPSAVADGTDKLAHSINSH